MQSEDRYTFMGRRNRNNSNNEPEFNKTKRASDRALEHLIQASGAASLHLCSSSGQRRGERDEEKIAIIVTMIIMEKSNNKELYDH